MNKGWRTGCENVECSLADGKSLRLSTGVLEKINLLMKHYESLEWLGYLTGTIDEEGNGYATNIHIPPHAVTTGVSAEAEPFHTPENTISLIHSHAAMGAFHSQTDKDYADGNYPFSLVVSTNKKSEWDLMCTSKTPCGRIATTEGELELEEVEIPLSLVEWFDDAVTNIELGVKPTLPSYYTYNNPYYSHTDTYYSDYKEDEEYWKSLEEKLDKASEYTGTFYNYGGNTYEI